MTSTLKTFVAVAFLAASTSVGAQTAVPEIPFDANIDVVKTGVDLYLGDDRHLLRTRFCPCGIHVAPPFGCRVVGWVSRLPIADQPQHSDT